MVWSVRHCHYTVGCHVPAPIHAFCDGDAGGLARSLPYTRRLLRSAVSHTTPHLPSPLEGAPIGCHPSEPPCAATHRSLAVSRRQAPTLLVSRPRPERATLRSMSPACDGARPATNHWTPAAPCATTRRTSRRRRFGPLTRPSLASPRWQRRSALRAGGGSRPRGDGRTLRRCGRPAWSSSWRT